MALTDKQRRFVDAKARGASNKSAAEAAGYAPSSAAAAGARLAKHPDIVAALEKLKGRRDVKSKEPSPKHDLGEADTSGDEQEPDGEYLDCLPFTDDPLVWLVNLMNEPRAKVFDRRSAAQKAVDFFHGKKGEQGKKDQKQAAAKEAAKGKFSAGKPPLTVVKR
ncbi:terminase small subunit [Pseudomonas citronellolis]|jgi:phage terminase small subunit|uniref:terminase small subunit n=1 Tax=Pseudomonas citronellolis TaxID=53408 RepID=UPI003899D71E